MSNKHIMKAGGQLSAQRKGTGWFALVLALVLALSWQSFVTQTHRHPEPAVSLSAASVVDSGAQKPGKQSPSDLPANCSICREMAHAGAALLPVPVAIDPPVLASYDPAPATPLALAIVQRSHAWRSRAPPTLQA